MKSAEKNLSVRFFVFAVTIKFDYFFLTRTKLHNFVVFVAKNLRVIISCTVHRNKLRSCLHEKNYLIQVRHLMIFLHINSFFQAVPPRHDCSFS